VRPTGLVTNVNIDKFFLFSTDGHGAFLFGYDCALNFFRFGFDLKQVALVC